MIDQRHFCEFRISKFDGLESRPQTQTNPKSLSRLVSIACFKHRANKPKRLISHVINHLKGTRAFFGGFWQECGALHDKN